MVSHAECGATRKPIKSNLSAGCGVRYKFENFENILFANVNFEADMDRFEISVRPFLTVFFTPNHSVFSRFF